MSRMQKIRVVEFKLRESLGDAAEDIGLDIKKLATEIVDALIGEVRVAYER